MRKIFVGELSGTFILVFFGCGAVATSLFMGTPARLWQVAAVWGAALTVAIYVSVGLSAAHLNPAVTIALALWRGTIGFKDGLVYVAGQLTGAVLAGGLLYLLLNDIIRKFESAEGLVRGAAGSQLSAMIFGEYFPNPAMGKLSGLLNGISLWQALFVEALGTALLAFAVFTLTRAAVPASLKPPLLGATLAVLIAILAPFTQAGFNPARDFGPRLVAYAAGWTSIAIPGPDAGFWIYIIGPIIGALAGGGIYQKFFEKRGP